MEDAIGTVLVFIVIIIAVIGRIIQAAMEQGGEGERVGGQADRSAGGQYSASPDDIREFLEGLGSPRKPQSKEPPAPPREAPEKKKRPEPAPSRLAEQTPDTWESNSGTDRGMPSGPVEEQPTVPATDRTRRERAARRKARKARQKAARHTSAGEGARKRVDVSHRVEPGRGDLKSAIIWSEILGPPVSRRKRPGHRPPGLPK